MDLITTLIQGVGLVLSKKSFPKRVIQKSYPQISDVKQYPEELSQ